ncbi:hypothetical protein BDEG_27851 [Batrachochytrium dendrobatidis JEL423]|uniref:Uncharacterized protein n=1 Tax=Batrachochytrium dendrobatidis (strain JEL423) TaxID=403673 RepID=A0A177WYR5_BATDL|nr:hypothetical protein BDEG_27851 [Batrachochytrium dendrobatidis JEL423]
MKLAVTVLSSILFACSVTTANPVNPSATTSTDASTSTTQPTATESNKSGLWTASNEEIATWVDVSQFTKADAELIKQYLKLTQKYEKAKEMRNLLKKETGVQEKLVKQLDQESWWFLRQFKKGKGPKYGKKLNEAREKYRKEEIKRIKLEKEYHKADLENIDLNFKLDFSKKELTKLLFGDNLDSPLFYSHMHFMASNIGFVENILKFLNLQLDQQSESEQASTSGTQSLPRNYKSLSSKTPTDQPTQISSNTKGTFKVRSSTRKAYSKMKSSLGSRWSQFKNDDDSSDSDD